MTRLEVFLGIFEVFVKMVKPLLQYVMYLLNHKKGKNKIGSVKDQTTFS